MWLKEDEIDFKDLILKTVRGKEGKLSLCFKTIK